MAQPTGWFPRSRDELANVGEIHQTEGLERLFADRQVHRALRRHLTSTRAIML
jgi:hypothetical protein